MENEFQTDPIPEISPPSSYTGNWCSILRELRAVDDQFLASEQVSTKAWKWEE